MKKIYLSVLSLALFSGLNAQTLTQANHAPAPGESYTLSTVTGTVAPGGSGAGTTWNFSSASLSSTTTVYQASVASNAQYPSANVRVEGTAGEESFYQSTSGNLTYFGGNVIVGSVPVMMTYTSGAIVAAYPMSLNTTTTSITGGTLSAFGSPGAFNGTCVVTADATGTLILTGRTFNSVIRVQTMQDLRLNVPAFGVSNGTLTQVNYDYYDASSKYPVFTISTSTVDAPPVVAASSNTVITALTNYLTVNIRKHAETQLSASVFPNPAANELNFVSDSQALTAELFSVTGIAVKRQTSSNGTLTIDVSQLPAGIYMYTLSTQDGKQPVSGKIVVTH
jgi:hypothetical protein